MLIQRIYQNLGDYLQESKVLVIYGPRQVGKTTLLNIFLRNTNYKYKIDTGENVRTQSLFASQDIKEIISYAQGYDLIVIDEAQKIPFIGNCLKMLVDFIPKIRVIVTGSSSFELVGQVGEPLTGRKNTLTLFPISQLELKNVFNNFELEERLEDWLIFGTYPEVVTATTKGDKMDRLKELYESYLLKDVLALERVKGLKILLDLLRLLAFQIGSEVSLSELGRQLGIDSKTVARYLDIFEKAFVVYNLRGYSGNLRKEITKKSKYYFYDNGIRNAIINNFNPIDSRNDIGQLWENYLFMERLKKNSYTKTYTNYYFWRTWDKKEIDLIEERGGKLFGYEFKWGDKKTKPPKDWTETYKNSEYTVINKENYLGFISDVV